MGNKRFERKPWGWYLTLFDRKRFKIKILKFNDLCTCSLQYHRHRNELWLIMYGKGKYKIDQETGFIKSGECFLVNKMQKHKFYSIGCSIVLEIQYGDKCDENDIVRL